MSIKMVFPIIIFAVGSFSLVSKNVNEQTKVVNFTFSSAENKVHRIIPLILNRNDNDAFESISEKQLSTTSANPDKVANKDNISQYENIKRPLTKISLKMRNSKFNSLSITKYNRLSIQQEFSDPSGEFRSRKKAQIKLIDSSPAIGDQSKTLTLSHFEDWPSTLRDNKSFGNDTIDPTILGQETILADAEIMNSSAKNRELVQNERKSLPVGGLGVKSTFSEAEEVTETGNSFQLSVNSRSRPSVPSYLSSPSPPSSPNNPTRQLMPSRVQRFQRTSGLADLATGQTRMTVWKLAQKAKWTTTSERPTTAAQTAGTSKAAPHNRQQTSNGEVVSSRIRNKRNAIVAGKYISTENHDVKMKFGLANDSHQSSNGSNNSMEESDKQQIMNNGVIEVEYSNHNLLMTPLLNYSLSSHQFHLNKTSPRYVDQNDEDDMDTNDKETEHQSHDNDLLRTGGDVVGSGHRGVTLQTEPVASQQNHHEASHSTDREMLPPSVRDQVETRRLLDAAEFATTPQHRSAGPERDYVEVGAAGAPDRRKIALYVYISKNGAVVAVDGQEVYRSWNHTTRWSAVTVRRLHAGVHVLVLHARTGHVMRAAKFTTWEPASAAQLVTELRAVNEGRILVLLGAPDFVKDLTAAAEEFVSALGSQFFQSLVLYESMVFVVRTGGPVLYEAARTKYEQPSSAKLARGYEWDGPPLVVDALIDVIDTPRCPSSSALRDEHAHFCETHAGFGDFCDCNTTLASVVPPGLPVNSSLPLIAVALVGGLRLPQVLDQVRVIRTHPAGQHVPLIMCLDGARPAAQHLAQLLNISVAIADDATVKRGTLSRINIMIQFAVTVVFRQFQLAQFAVILEDDIQVSPDIMSYFQQTAPLLDQKSEMLLCVNAYNTHSYPNTAFNLSRLIRHSGTFAYGWMITRAVGKELEEIDFWPAEYIVSDWDFFYRGNVQGRRHILAPEVSRSHHQGAGGVHISGVEQERYYNARFFNSNVSYVKMDIASAYRNVYIRFHLARVRRSVPLDLRKRHPCEAGILDDYPANASLVAFLDMPTEEDEFRAFEVTMKCLGSNDKGNQENLSMMYLIHPTRRPLYLVGCPNSYFCTEKNNASNWFRPTKADIKYTEKVYFERKPLLTRFSYREHTADPSKEFTLDNGYEQYANVYVY